MIEEVFSLASPLGTLFFFLWPRIWFAHTRPRATIKIRVAYIILYLHVGKCKTVGQMAFF